MSDPMETENDTEGMKNLRSAFDKTKDENVALRKELALTKLGVDPNDTQMKALDAVIGDEWADHENVKSVYEDLFGTSTTPTKTAPAPEPGDVSGETIESAPEPPGDALLGDVTDMTAGANAAPGQQPEEDPVSVGYREYHQDLAGGRRREDASAQVLNRLIDRGAKGQGTHDHDEYQRALQEGRIGAPPEVRELHRG